MKIIASSTHSHISAQTSTNAIGASRPNKVEKITKNITEIINLPTEIHYKIANHLTATSYANLRETCHAFREKFESFQSLSNIATSEIYQGELKERAINITKQRHSIAIQNDRDIMGALTNLKVSLTQIRGIYIYNVSFMTSIDTHEEKKEKLLSPLQAIAKLSSPQISGAYAGDVHNMNIGFDIKNYDYYYVLNDPSQSIASEPPIERMIALLQSEWDKCNALNKYLIAAYTEKIINFCEETPLLGIEKKTLNEMREQYAPLISAGKFINAIAEQQRTHAIDYLLTSNKNAFSRLNPYKPKNDHLPSVDCCLQKQA